MSHIKDILIDLQENPELRHKRLYQFDEVEGVSVATNNSEYWHWCLEVVLAAGKLASRTKLVLNYTDPTTRIRVADVVKRYYDSNLGNLKDAREAAWDEYAKTIDMVNRLARKNGLRQVNQMKLVDMLDSEGERRKFRTHIRKHIENEDTPFSMDEIPSRDFRQTKK